MALPPPTRHQAVAAVLLVQRLRSPHRGLGGVGRGLVKHRVGQGARACPQRGHRAVQQASRFHARVGHDQRFAHPGAPAFAGQQLQGAKVDLDVGQVQDL